MINSIGVDGSGYKQYKTGPGLLVSFTHTENILLWVTLDKGKDESALSLQQVVWTGSGKSLNTLVGVVWEDWCLLWSE